MSANITAASTPWRRDGLERHLGAELRPPADLEEVKRLRSSRYSGSERPAWRMNQTGVRSTGSRRAGADEKRLGHVPRLVRVRVPVPPHPVPAGPLAVRWLGYELPAVPRRRVAVRARSSSRTPGSATWRSRRRTRRPSRLPLARSARQPDRLGGTRSRRSRGRSRRASASTLGSRFERRCRRAATGSRSTSSTRAASGSRSSATSRSSSTSTSAPRIAGAHAGRRGRGPARPSSPRRRERRSRRRRSRCADRRRRRSRIPRRRLPPAPDWSRRVLDAHAEGYRGRRRARSTSRAAGRDAARLAELARGARASGARPAGRMPLLCPSSVRPRRPTHHGLEPSPACPPSTPAELDEPWLCDGRIRVARRRLELCGETIVGRA